MASDSYSSVRTSRVGRLESCNAVISPAFITWMALGVICSAGTVGVSANSARIRVGDTFRGTFDGGQVLIGDRLWDAVRFFGTSGQILDIDVRSETFRPVLLFGRDDAVGTELMSFDDGQFSAASSATLRVILPVDGEYTCFIRAAEKGSGGAYELEIRRATANRPRKEPPSGWRSLYPGGGDPNDRYALLVGIDLYPPGVSNLYTCVADTRVMRDVLVRRYGFRPENIVMIHDNSATVGHVVAAIKGHLGQAGPDGVAFLFLSGHGTKLDQRLPIVPAEYDPETDGRDEAVVLWSDSRDYDEGNRYGLLVDDQIGILIGSLQTDHTIAAFDMCFAGTMTMAPGEKQVKYENIKGQVQLAELSEELVEKTLSARERGRWGSPVLHDHVLLASSADVQVSYCGPLSGWLEDGFPDRGGMASVFTYFLAKAMDEHPRSATFEQIMDEAGARTRHYSQRMNFPVEQTPQLLGVRRGDSIGEFLQLNADE